MKVMEQKRLTMSTSFKLIIPLINENLKSEYIIDYSDFEGVFNKDVNNPHLTNHIFLVYNNSNSIESVKRHNHLVNLKNLSKWYTKNNKTIYSFKITNKAIIDIMCNIPVFGEKDSIRILSFWKMNEADINSCILTNPMIEDFKNNIISI